MGDRLSPINVGAVAARCERIEDRVIRCDQVHIARRLVERISDAMASKY
jgi:hypothetical protein